MRVMIHITMAQRIHFLMTNRMERSKSAAAFRGGCNGSPHAGQLAACVLAELQKGQFMNVFFVLCRNGHLSGVMIVFQGRNPNTK